MRFPHILVTVTLTVLFLTSTLGLAQTEKYEISDFSNLIGMNGFSDTMLRNHFKLYGGYVKNTNLLAGKLTELSKSNQAVTPEYAELKRRFGFEFNGMRLHEYYFGNLGGDGIPNKDLRIINGLAKHFGSVEDWKADFIATGAMRGIGWVVLYQDEETGNLFNAWINEHEIGHLAGCNPLIVMDVFEHAYMTDYQLDRKSYITAFFKNLDWNKIEKRLLR